MPETELPAGTRRGLGPVTAFGPDGRYAQDGNASDPEEAEGIEPFDLRAESDVERPIRHSCARR